MNTEEDTMLTYNRQQEDCIPSQDKDPRLASQDADLAFETAENLLNLLMHVSDSEVIHRHIPLVKAHMGLAAQCSRLAVIRTKTECRDKIIKTHDDHIETLNKIIETLKPLALAKEKKTKKCKPSSLD